MFSCQPPRRAAAHSDVRKATGIGEQSTRVQSDQIRISTDIHFQSQRNLKHPKNGCRGYLAFDIVHAVEFSKIRRSQQTHPKAIHQGNFSNLPHLEVLSNRTGLSFSGRLIHIEDFVVWVFHADTMIRNWSLCFSAGVLVGFGSGPFGFRPRQLVYCTTDSEAVKAISLT